MATKKNTPDAKTVAKAPTSVKAVYLDEERDIGPWLETPASTRVSRFRYDFGERAVQVQWRNNANHGYIYEDVQYETYRGMARAASKGKYINSPLNGHSYRLMSDTEVGAPSNSDRKKMTSGRGIQ